MSLGVVGALVRKELREHALIMLAALTLSVIALLGYSAMSDEQGGRFVAFVRFSAAAGVMNAVIAANRLFVREYAGRTQLFLEVLPIGRTRVFATKWLLGALWTGLLTAGAWAYTLVQQRKVEVIALPDALHVLHATATFVLTVWSFAAMAGMLGRHRYTAWIAAIVLLAVAVDSGGLATDEIPVARLLGEPVRMARAAVPWSALLEAWAIAALCTAAAAALALVGSGAMASVLAKRMTVRERVFMLAAGITAIFLYQTLRDEREKPPFALAAAEYAPSKHAHVGVMPTQDFDVQSAAELAGLIGADVDSLIEALELDVRPTIFVLPQQGLDRWVIERAALSGNSGIVLRVAPNVPRDTLRAEVLHSVLVDFTLRRALKEDRHVLLDGFVAWWALRDDPVARERWWLRAAAAPLPVTGDRLTRWLETSEQLGECLALSYAFASVDTLAQRIGPAKLLELMRALWREPRDDVRVLFETSPREQLERVGMSWSSLAQHTERARQAAQVRNAQLLARRPRLRGELEVATSEKRGVTIESGLQGAPAYWVRYAYLEPWAQYGQDMSRFDVRGTDESARGTLPMSPRSGSRLFARIEVEDPVLDCPIAVLAKRIELP